MIRYFTTLRELAGTKEEKVEFEDGSILTNLIDKISSQYGEEAFNYLHVKVTHEVDPTIQFLINGVAANRLQGLQTTIKEGDVVAIIPPIGGG